MELDEEVEKQSLEDDDHVMVDLPGMQVGGPAIQVAQPVNQVGQPATQVGQHVILVVANLGSTELGQSSGPLLI